MSRKIIKINVGDIENWTPEWEKSGINIEAEVYGRFAIHRKLGYRKEWTVTHLNLGTAVRSGKRDIPYLHTRQKARHLVKKLKKVKGFAELKTIKVPRKMKSKIVSILKQYPCNL